MVTSHDSKILTTLFDDNDDAMSRSYDLLLVSVCWRPLHTVVYAEATLKLGWRHAASHQLGTVYQNPATSEAPDASNVHYWGVANHIQHGEDHVARGSLRRIWSAPPSHASPWAASPAVAKVE